MSKKWKERCSAVVAALGLFAMSCDKFAVVIIGGAMLAAGMLELVMLEVEKWS